MACNDPARKARVRLGQRSRQAVTSARRWPATCPSAVTKIGIPQRQARSCSRSRPGYVRLGSEPLHDCETVLSVLGGNLKRPRSQIGQRRGTIGSTFPHGARKVVSLRRFDDQISIDKASKTFRHRLVVDTGRLFQQITVYRRGRVKSITQYQQGPTFHLRHPKHSCATKTVNMISLLTLLFNS